MDLESDFGGSERFSSQKRSPIKNMLFLKGSKWVSGMVVVPLFSPNDSLIAFKLFRSSEKI